MIIDVIQGRAVPIEGDDIDTDQILPAKFMKEITFANMGKYLFYDLRFDQNNKSKNYVIDQPQYAQPTFLITQKNFGCGSSREHAPQAIKRFGIRAIVGESFAEIFTGNCKALGIPLVTLRPDYMDLLLKAMAKDPRLDITLDLYKETIAYNNYEFPIGLKPAFRNAFLSGTWDSLSLLKKNQEKILELEKQLSY